MSEHSEQVVAALTAAEVAARLSVHAWVALERQDSVEAMRLLAEVATVTAAAQQGADVDEETAAQVAKAARAVVNPLIGWSPTVAA